MPHLLIVDDDGDARPMLAAALARPQRTIDLAANGAEALACVRQRKPDLILTDVVMPGMDGWALVRRLRTHTDTAFIPVIFVTGLASEAHRIHGFRLGADDYVCKPVNSVELELRVENALHHAHLASRHEHTIPGLTGSLAQFGLASVLNLLSLERRTGVLMAEQNDCGAVLHLRDGEIVRARFDGVAHLESKECVYVLLDWSQGRFAFSEEPVDCADEIATSTSELLLEAARRMDEVAR